MSFTSSSRNVLELWGRLDQMEQELRFQGQSYPPGMCKFPFRLAGQGFFPGGDGLWREQAELMANKEGALPKAGVVFIGNDFGTLASYNKLKNRGYENVPTWRHLKARVRNAGLPTEKTFFTNAIMGLREEGSALGRRNWQGLPLFAQFCREFLQFQLEILAPRLVVVMGPNARVAFEAFAIQFHHYRVLYTRHPYADFGLPIERIKEENEALSNAWACA